MPSTRHQPTLAALLTAWVGIIVFTAHLLMSAEIRQHERMFDEETQSLSANIKSKLDTNETVLSGLSAFLKAVERDDIESTQRYAAAAASAYPHIYMIEIARKVALSDQQRLETSLRHGWRPDFTLKRFAELTQRTDKEQVRKPDTWPILFMHPVLPEAEAVYGLRLETVDYLSHTLARAQGNTRAVASPVFKLYEGGNAYILLQEIVRQPRVVENASLNFFGNTMAALILIKTDSLIPAPSPGRENSQISFSAEFSSNREERLFGKSIAEGSTLDKLMLPRFKRVERINNGTQPLVVTYTQQLRWIDFLDTSAITIFLLLLCGFFFIPWLTIRHYKAICEAHVAHEKSAYLATHDVLTDLPNRFLFNDRLNQAALNWQRNGSHFAIMLIDLDNFKEVNDNFGHEAGDQVLCEAAKRMTLELRSFDTVARYGGDEFIVLLTNVVDAEDTQLIGEKIRAAISLPITTKAGELTISCSIGIAVCPTHSEYLDTLRQLADLAMYEAKQGGRNTVAFAHSSSVARQA